MINNSIKLIVNNNIRNIDSYKKKTKEYNDIFIYMIDNIDRERFKRRGIFTISFELHIQ